MREETRAARAAQIQTAALEVLMERGWGAASMLAVAQAAGASNQTLYRWYGDKRGLFRAVVAGNAAQVRGGLERAALGSDPLEALEASLVPLLSMVTSPSAVALNRAAAADESGALGADLAEAGRDAVFAAMVALLSRVEGLRLPAEEAADLLLRLLIGDWQVRRVTRAMEQPEHAQILAQAERAWGLFRQLALPDVAGER